jgi:hypothetical protein
MSIEPSSGLVWLEPAPRGMALAVELFLTNDEKIIVEQKLATAGTHSLVRFAPLSGGGKLVVTTHHYACGPQEIRVPLEPRVPGQVFGELFFPDSTLDDKGRPVRMVLPLLDSDRPVVWELGGYEVRGLESQ